MTRFSDLHQNKKWKRLQLSEEAKRHFIGPQTTRYIPNPNGKQDNCGSAEKVVFAAGGGTELNNVMELIEKEISLLSFTSREDVVVVDYKDNRVTVQLCDGDESECVASK